MRDSRLTFREKSIYYQFAGKGRLVVLLHGIPVNGNVWADTVKELEKDYLVIIPDTPGTGQSDMLEGSASIEDYADVIKAIIDNETSNDSDLQKATIIGHSMGGYIALAFAEKYPGLLNGLGLFHSTAFADDEEKKQTRLKAIDFIRANGAYSFLKTSTPNLFTDKQHHSIEQIIEESRNFKSEALVQYYQAMIKRPDRTDVLKKIQPVLFIIGEKDVAVPLDSSLKQCHMPAVSDVNILDTGHMGMIEENIECNRIIQRFLQNI